MQQLRELEDEQGEQKATSDEGESEIVGELPPAAETAQPRGLRAMDSGHGGLWYSRTWNANKGTEW